jgi:GNAT superfamily N-acetyltransferase
VEEQGGRLVITAIRTLTSSDIPSAVELSAAANWNQTPEDWHRIMHLSAKTCRCIEDAGKVVATTTLLPYGTHLAWIGMVLTHPECRRQGLARRLMEDAISSAEREGIRTLKLDATDEGRPLYESLGFVVEKIVERWGIDSQIGDAAQNAADNSSATNFCSHDVAISDNLLAQDTSAFGVSRNRLLELLSQSGRRSVTAHGYVLSRPGTKAQYLGPCLADSEAEASMLIAAHLRNHSNPQNERSSSDLRGWYWDLFPANPGAARCARRLGFTRRRTLWRMRRGQEIENNDAMVYAIAGFELG